MDPGDVPSIQLLERTPVTTLRPMNESVFRKISGRTCVRPLRYPTGWIPRNFTHGNLDAPDGPKV
jgi:hypothetical protein